MHILLPGSTLPHGAPLPPGAQGLQVHSLPSQQAQEQHCSEGVLLVCELTGPQEGGDSIL